jgi:catechol 2,3-dioxygenase-like lactoylglutathione lyase family enzyme
MMLLRRLDHVALFVSSPEKTAELLLRRLPFRVLERADDFVLVGRSPSLGKLTLFSAPPPRERGALVRLGLATPCGTERAALELTDGLVLDLVPAAAEGDVDLHHVALEVADPAVSAHAWARLGLERAEGDGDGAERVRLGSTVVELYPGRPAPTDRPLLNHVGLLVDSIEDVYRGVAERGIEVTREVDAENSIAVFVAGPDDVEVEYIEHKPSFALA